MIYPCFTQNGFYGDILNKTLITCHDILLVPRGVTKVRHVLRTFLGGESSHRVGGT